MKKILTVILALIMIMNSSIVTFASNNNPTLIGQTRDITYYISFYEDAQMTDSKASQQFTVSSTTNLKLIMASTQSVRVRLYNVNTGLYLTLDNGQRYVTVPGDVSSHTISLKSSCPTGTYRLEFYSDYTGLFYSVYTVCGSQYF